MKLVAQDRVQTSQRVKVGMIGLAAVLLLIGLAAAIFSTANRDKPVTAAGAAQPDVIANITTGNAAQANDDTAKEPLAELGVAPSTSSEANNAAVQPDGQHPIQ